MILLKLYRVPYGLKSTPLHKREYKMKNHSAVGTTLEWAKFAEKNKYHGLHLHDKTGKSERKIVFAQYKQIKKVYKKNLGLLDIRGKFDMRQVHKNVIKKEL